MKFIHKAYSAAVGVLKAFYTAVTWPFAQASQEVKGTAKGVAGRVVSALRVVVWTALAITSIAFPAVPVVVVAALTYLAWMDVVVMLATTVMVVSANALVEGWGAASDHVFKVMTHPGQVA